MTRTTVKTKTDRDTLIDNAEMIANIHKPFNSEKACVLHIFIVNCLIYKPSLINNRQVPKQFSRQKGSNQADNFKRVKSFAKSNEMHPSYLNK